jgi:hypothetical protein
VTRDHASSPAGLGGATLNELAKLDVLVTMQPEYRQIAIDAISDAYSAILAELKAVRPDELRAQRRNDMRRVAAAALVSTRKTSRRTGNRSKRICPRERSGTSLAADERLNSS